MKRATFYDLKRGKVAELHSEMLFNFSPVTCSPGSPIRAATGGLISTMGDGKPKYST